MKLKDFVAETLKELIDGVIDPQDYCSAKGASINSTTIVYQIQDSSQMMDQRDGRRAQMVEFDVAVTATEGTETKGGIGVFVGAIGLGSQGKSDSANSSVSRIKFSIPVVLPSGTPVPTSGSQ